MDINGEIMISPQHTKEDYINLSLSIESDGVLWEKALNILRDRIEGIYLNQIEILSENVRSNGFTIMALNCLLIEALLQFRNGEDKTSGKNCRKYTSFLRKEFPDVFHIKSLADRFYYGIRCGILHSAQTYGKTRLSEGNNFIVKLEDDVLAVSVARFSECIREYFNRYINDLSDRSKVSLRGNFIKKMTFICDRDAVESTKNKQ